MLLHVRNFGLAFSFSAVALLATMFLQALALFRGPVASRGNIIPARIECLSICDEDRRALLLVREPMTRAQDPARYTMALFSTRAPPAPLSLPTVDFVPWRITGARRAPFAFMASNSGDLYALNLTAHGAPISLGRHQEPFPWLLECTDDGELVLVASNTSVSCWDRAHARCLWVRDNCDLLRGSFASGTHRLFALQMMGQIVELDANSGVTLRELPSHCDYSTFFDISPNGHCLVTVDAIGICVVSELTSSKPLWSRRFSFPPVKPQFSADGSILVAVDQRPSRVALVSATNGDSLGELTGARAEIIGLAVSPHGAIYAWDISGTVSVWDLESRVLLFQFRPRQFM